MVNALIIMTNAAFAAPCLGIMQLICALFLLQTDMSPRKRVYCLCRRPMTMILLVDEINFVGLRHNVTGLQNRVKWHFSAVFPQICVLWAHIFAKKSVIIYVLSLRNVYLCLRNSLIGRKMERKLMSDLVKWKENPNRKPLILLGARQVGKTWLLKEFGRRYYDNVAYVNCDNNPLVKDLFAQDYDMERIIMTISAITRQTITPERTLIILDEIQETQRGLASLKYFCEEAREYHVAVAGSLLGIQIHRGESYPAGKVDTLPVFPMSFSEFLRAKGEDKMVEFAQEGEWSAIAGMKSRYTQLLREYYFVGGMPEAVQQFVDTKDPNTVRNIQNEILQAYSKDVSKHAPIGEVVRINQVWRSIPSQLAKENRRFVYGVIKKGARAKEYEVAIQWLIDAGLVYKIPRIASPAIPLSNYEDVSAFKLYVMDCGLLGAMSNVPPVMMLLPSGMGESKGSFTENFVCAQMETIPDLTIAYYSREDSQLEIDFVIQLCDRVIPVEVKAEENLKSKSLKTFLSNHSSLHGVRVSMSDYREQENITNVPLYCFEAYLRNIKARRDKEIRNMLSSLL